MKICTGTFTDKESLLEFADDNKCYCQFDLFGTECSFYQLNPLVDMLSDAQRIDYVQLLRDEGKLERVLISHDIHTKHRLVRIMLFSFLSFLSFNNIYLYRVDSSPRLIMEAMVMLISLTTYSRNLG